MEEDDDARTDSRSQSQSDSRTPPPSPPSAHPVTVVASSSGHGHSPSSNHHSNGGRITEPVTVAASPLHGLTLALPIQQTCAGGPGSGGGGGREDCWSEGATSTLIDAWGERYLELSRSNLRQKHWQEVADSVAGRDGYTKVPKTDAQCKNRIDTLKKKYKNEKAKIAVGGGGFTSSWPFFHRLDLLLGPNQKSASASSPPSHPDMKILAGVPIWPALHPHFPQRQRSRNPPFKKIRSSPPSASFKSDGTSGESSDGLPPPPPPPRPVANGKRQGLRVEEEEEGGGGGGRIAGLRELTRAIARFGEVYERVESSKLQQAMEMEKQRMSFAKELEVQRMQFFMKTQMELSQLRNHSSNNGNATGGRRGGRSSKKRRWLAAAPGGGSSNHQLLHDNSSIDNRGCKNLHCIIEREEVSIGVGKFVYN